MWGLRHRREEEGATMMNLETKVALPFVGMVMVECAQAGQMIISKAAMSKGMNNLILVFYSNALASLILLPSSLLFHRSQRPQLSFSIFCGFFLLGLLGCLAQIFEYAGINLSSPTLGTAIFNLIPGFTFVLAVVFRMEKLDLRSFSTLAKSVGTIISIAGAFIITYYKGPQLLRMLSSPNSSYRLLFQQSNWALGGFLLAAYCVMASAWFIVQALILKKCPVELIVVFFYCFFVTIQSATVCLAVEGYPAAWSLKPNIRLIAVLYSGIFGSAFRVGVSTWCLSRRGPVFVSMFKPLGIVIAAAVGVISSDEAFYVGGLVGATVIVTGLYLVMWGKAKEWKAEVDPGVWGSGPSSQRAPLLQSYDEEG